ncbi:hypothetical protein J2X68_006841 [Streptomyces sp. 3330]|nr:hypothetical protein [Streptomyces sp. 3330]
MESTDNSIHQSEDPWNYTPSTPTRSASRIGDAWVMQGVENYELEDLNALRRRFPYRRVTLDGDVITVWPSFTGLELEPGPIHHQPHMEQGRPVRFPHPIPATSRQAPQQPHESQHVPASRPT